MNQILSQFLERLTERLTALLAGLISSRFEGFHAAAKAQQQSQLEDLARQYESEGKNEIANGLRHHAHSLMSPDLAHEATESMRLLTIDSSMDDSGKGTSRGKKSSDNLRQLPDFGIPRQGGRKGKVGQDCRDASPDRGDAS